MKESDLFEKHCCCPLIFDLIWLKTKRQPCDIASFHSAKNKRFWRQWWWIICSITYYIIFVEYYRRPWIILISLLCMFRYYLLRFIIFSAFHRPFFPVLYIFNITTMKKKSTFEILIDFNQLFGCCLYIFFVLLLRL